jgi:hypothetical protein
MYWGGVSDGAYWFDSNVPDHIKQATYWADDGWAFNYHDQNNSSGTRITVSPLPSGVLGRYDANINTLEIAQDLVNMCSSACNYIISTISHEFGHTIGFDHFEAGCESSVMSWWRDRWTVFNPSAEDLCWYFNDSGPGNCEGPDCVPADRIMGNPSVTRPKEPVARGGARGRS